MSRVLVAGIGNVFAGDDGFGVEVVARLRERRLPDGVEPADYGIRAFDLACSLMDGYDAAILVDAMPRGKRPGTVTVLEPELDDGVDAQAVNGHAMDPVEVFRLVRRFGQSPPPTYIVGCEPAAPEAQSEDAMALSPAVAGAVEEAAAVVESLAVRLLDGAVHATPKER